MGVGMQENGVKVIAHRPKESNHGRPVSGRKNQQGLPPVHQKKSAEMNGKIMKRTITTDILHPYSSVPLANVRNILKHKLSLVGPQAVHDKGKLTVVLDVDETLVHSRLTGEQEDFRQFEERKVAGACDEFSITLADGEVVHVNKRPGLDQFLRRIAEKFEVCAYTAGLEEYARPLLDHLDPDGTIFKHRLYRDSCLFMKGYYVKDLQMFNREMGRIVLVDNNPFTFLPQLENGIPISSFYDDPNDSALDVLANFLERINGEDDIRPFLRKSFSLETLLSEHRSQIIG